MVTEAVKSVVLVDDDPIFVSLCQKFVKFGGFPVELQAYTNPVTALEAVKEACPDLVLVDLNMPILSGWQFIESLSAQEMDCELHILTSSIDSRDERRAESYPIVKGFIHKPLTRRQFNNLVAPTA